MGFALPASVPGAAVRSSRSFSPLPAGNTRQAVLFSVALSVKPALNEPPRPLAGMLPYGDRTFLPPAWVSPRRPAAARPAGPHSLSGFVRPMGNAGPENSDQHYRNFGSITKHIHEVF